MKFESHSDFVWTHFHSDAWKQQVLQFIQKIQSNKITNSVRLILTPFDWKQCWMKCGVKYAWICMHLYQIECFIQYKTYNISFKNILYRNNTIRR